MADPAAAVVGVDGAVWTLSRGLVMNRVDPRTGKARGVRNGAIDRASLPNEFADPQMAVGADGRIYWYGEAHGGAVIVRRTVNGGVNVVSLRKARVPVPDGGLTDLETGPDGAVWFAGRGVVGRVSESGQVRWWRIPRGTLGYPEEADERVRLAAGTDGRMWFTADVGLGSVTARGVFGRVVDMGGATDVTRGGDERMWTVANNSGTLHRLNPDGSITSSVASTDFVEWRWPSMLAAGDGVLTVMSVHDERLGIIGDDVVFNTTPTPSDEDGGWFIGSPRYGHSDQSPGRGVMLFLPDGRLWVSLTDWGSFESYEKPEFLKLKPSVGKARLLKADRIGNVVRVRVRCVGRTGGWYQGKAKATVAGHRSVARSFTVATGPMKVNSRTMVRLRLSSAQLAAVKRGARVTVSVGAKRIRVRG